MPVGLIIYEKRDNMSEPFRKICVNLPNSIDATLSDMAERHGPGTTRTGVLIRAIRIARYMDDARAKGKEIVIRDPNTGDETVIEFVS